jgi:hypothetical protein
VLLLRKHHAGVLCVSIPHERSIYIYAYSFQLPGIALARDPAFRCRLEGDSPRPQDMMVRFRPRLRQLTPP